MNEKNCFCASNKSLLINDREDVKIVNNLTILVYLARMIETNSDSKYLVSNLTLDETINELGGFDFTKFIPRNTLILNCGSGIYRTFEQDLLVQKPDISIISVDPSLGVMTINRNGFFTTQGYQVYVNIPHGIVYEPLDSSNSSKIFRDNQAIQFDRERKSILSQIPGAIAADGIKLPFKKHVFDTIIDVRGAMLYIKQDYQIMEQYFSELKRTLKKDGFIVSIIMDPIQREVITNLKMRKIRFAQNAFLVTN